MSRLHSRPPGVICNDSRHTGAECYRPRRVARRCGAGRDRMLRLLAVVVGIGWAIAFIAVGLMWRLQEYGDGSIFSYAVAVRDAFAFHWHNISGRLSVFLMCLLPAQLYVGVT